MKFDIPIDIKFLNEIAVQDLLCTPEKESEFAKLVIWWMGRGIKSYQGVYWKMTKEHYELLDSLDLYSLSENSLLWVLEAPIIHEKLFKKIKIFFSQIQDGLPRYLAVIKSNRPDLEAKFANKNDKYIDWYLSSGVEEYPFMKNHGCYDGLFELISDEGLFKLLGSKIKDTNLYEASRKCLLADRDGLPRYLAVIKSNRPDLEAKFANKNDKYIDWYLSSGVEEYPFVNNALRDQFNKIKGRSKLDLEKDVGHINVFGLFDEEKGVGEDARLICCALELGGFVVNRCAPSFLKNVYGRPIFNAINLYILPPIEYVRHKIGLSASEKSFINGPEIGIFPWELPTWPPEFRDYFDDLLEIWAPSEFIKQTFGTFKNNVFQVNYPVVLPNYSKVKKEIFGIEKSCYVFFIAFDVNSWFSRKNPWLGIQAFIERFSNNSDVHLLIKLNNFDSCSESSKDILELKNFCKDHNNITLLHEKTDRAQFIGILDACDCLISTHRSEGFGRIIAEAMLLKKDVVVSNYSGNIDFCNSSTAYLVDGETVSLSRYDYPLGKNSEWFNPSIKSCKDRLDEVYKNRKCTQKRDAAFKLIKNNYSLEYISYNYKNLLKRIANVPN